MKKIIRLLTIIFLIVMPDAVLPQAAIPGGTSFADRNPSPAEIKPDEALLRTAYGGEEILRYSVSWLGLKSGELVMRIAGQGGTSSEFLVEVTVKSAGLLGMLYPVEDYFTTIVSGRSRLPLRHEMIQREGRRKNNKVTVYDQTHGWITYTKNNDPPEFFAVDGPVHNEFSSFLFLRVIPFAPGKKTVVPTFADRKRHLVEVIYTGCEELKTIFGGKKTLEVRPHLPFKGLYQKVGDPHIWLIDDPFRIPVRISAEILIGSLTADLIEYQGVSGNFKSENE